MPSRKDRSEALVQLEPIETAAIRAANAVRVHALPGFKSPSLRSSQVPSTCHREGAESRIRTPQLQFQLQLPSSPAHSAWSIRSLASEVSRVLAELADGDFMCLDDAGQITAAYPFSALPTRHRVRISGEAAVFAMCAIDALGISAMTGRPVVIESADPGSGERVTVNVDSESSSWDPVTAVVYVGRTAGQCAGPSASVCCGHVNFFATGAAATAWAASHPEITGGILDQARALHVGIGIFGPLLR